MNGSKTRFKGLLRAVQNRIERKVEEKYEWFRAQQLGNKSHWHKFVLLKMIFNVNYISKYIKRNFKRNWN
jgi:hypothetical protein